MRARLFGSLSSSTAAHSPYISWKNTHPIFPCAHCSHTLFLSMYCTGVAAGFELMIWAVCTQPKYMIHGPIYVLRHILHAVCNTVCLKWALWVVPSSCERSSHFLRARSRYHPIVYTIFMIISISSSSSSYSYFYSLTLSRFLVGSGYIFIFITITMIATMNTTKMEIFYMQLIGSRQSKQKKEKKQRFRLVGIACYGYITRISVSRFDMVMKMHELAVFSGFILCSLSRFQVNHRHANSLHFSCVIGTKQ